jgi:hypothetical protein
VKKNVKGLLGAVGMVVAVNGAHADWFLDAKPLFKVVDEGLVTEQRLVVWPLFVNIDTNADDQPDKLAVRFRVSEAGSSTIDLNTQQRATLYPASPCSSPNWEGRDFEIRFGGDNSDNRVHVFLDLWVECEESGSFEFKEAHKTFVYSANVTGNGSSWVNQYNGWALAATGREDFSGDGDFENMMLLIRDNPNGTSTGRVVFTEMSDGTVVADNLTTIYVEK